MASAAAVGYFGDSARNSESNRDRRRHVFDGAGENATYHSDSESIGSRKSKTRYINAAIYVETVESTHSVTSLQTDSCSDEVTPHPHSSYHSNSTPFLTSRVSEQAVRRKCCRLDGNRQDDQTPRLDRTYRGEGTDTFRLSVASLSTTATAKEEHERNERKKEEAFKQWLARKEQEKRDKARSEKQKRVPVAGVSAEQREASFRRWTERKRIEEERRREEELMRRFRENERLEQERRRRDNDKEERLAEWVRRKEEEIKVMKTREERRAARAVIEEKKRRATAERAFREWVRDSRHKPLPVPLNQGELSMRGSTSQMYINPIPWQAT